MSKIVVIGATGAIGRAVVSVLAARHDIVEVGSTRGAYRVDSERSSLSDRCQSIQVVMLLCEKPFGDRGG